MEPTSQRSVFLRDTSPSGRSDSSESSSEGEGGLEGGLVQGASSSTRGWRRFLPKTLQPHRRGRTSIAFERWQARARKPIPPYQLLLIGLIVIIIVLVSLFIYYIVHLNSLIPRNDIQRVIASWGDSGTITSNQSHYPTDFSRDIKPIPCHSHNDYHRRVPLYEALSAGCVSVEADVWYSPRDLLVGHTLNSLTQTRTLQSMYIDPLIHILSHQNPTAIDSVKTNTTAASPHGIFDENPATPLILLIDIKTDGAKTFPSVVTALEPLRSRGWLTHFNGTDVVPGLITAVGTGNTPFDLLAANDTYRDIFFDAPLSDLWGEDAPADATHLYNATNSYYASVNFEATIGKLWHGLLTPSQVEKIRGQIGEAEKRGLKSRYWNTPDWPASKKEHVWDVLVKEGVGMLNVDDLEGAKGRKWES